MPSNENEYNGRVTRSRSRGAPVTESAASVATPAAKPQRKAATNASSTTKGRGGGKKSSSTARSTPAAEDANVVANVPRSSDTVAVVPPTPRNLRNGNGVAPPADNNNTPHPSESQAVAAPSETNLILRTLQSTSDRRDRELNGMWGQMNVQNNNIAKALDEMTDLRTVSNKLQHDVSGLQAGQQNLEGNVSGLQTDVSGLKTRVGNLENTFEDTVKEFVKEEIAKSTTKKRPSKRVEVEDVDNDELARLTRNASFSPTPSHTAQVAAASVDGSNDSFDEGEVGQTSVASRLFPDDAAAAPVHADNYRVFLRRLKDAMLHGQGGREVEMNACLKEAEHIMLNTELNEEWNTWHANFDKKSECARKLFSQYGLKPAAR